MDTGSFAVVHALAIIRMARTGRLVTASGCADDEVVAELEQLRAKGFATWMERRALWRITAEGTAHHAELLAGDTGPQARADIAPVHHRFLPLNRRFKELCTRWQLRGGVANDHSDIDYDRALTGELGVLDTEAGVVIGDLAAVRERFARYRTRLAAALDRVLAGDQTAFTGVMAESYHDVWMELHTDLLLSLGMTREAEEALEHAAGTAR